MLRQKVFELTSFGFWRSYLFDSLVALVGAFQTLDARVWLYYAAFEFFCYSNSANKAVDRPSFQESRWAVMRDL